MADESSLQNEIHQRLPFRSHAEEVSLGVVRTATLVKRGVAQVVGPYGITPAQYNVLRILRGAGATGLPTLDVRERLIEEAPGITRLVDKLQRAGLVRRSRPRADRRQVLCFITAKGLKLLQELDPIIKHGDEIGASGLSVQEQQHLIGLLNKVRAAIAAHNETPQP